MDHTKKAPIKVKVETKKTEPIKEVKPQIKEIKVKKVSTPRISGTKNVTFVSNGLSRFMKKGTVHRVTASHAQLLIDKGYGFVQD